MKTLNSILLALLLAILCASLIVGGLFFYNEYQDYQETKHNQIEETYNQPTDQPQQTTYEAPQDESQELTPSGLTVEEYNKLPHNNAGTNNQQYLKEME